MAEVNERSDYTTPLVPVAQWVWHLFKVEYRLSEGSPVLLTRYCVSTCTHIEGEVLYGDRWPGEHVRWAGWEPVKESVAAPRTVGSFYGVPLGESGWAAGERLAEAEGLH